jgi:hypothetical protein
LLLRLGGSIGHLDEATTLSWMGHGRIRLLVEGEVECVQLTAWLWGTPHHGMVRIPRAGPFPFRKDSGVELLSTQLINALRRLPGVGQRLTFSLFWSRAGISIQHGVPSGLLGYLSGSEDIAKDNGTSKYELGGWSRANTILN